MQGQALVGEVVSLRTSAAETARQLDELRLAQAQDQQTYEQLNTAFEDALQQLDTVSSTMDQASKLHDAVGYSRSLTSGECAQRPIGPGYELGKLL